MMIFRRFMTGNTMWRGRRAWSAWQMRRERAWSAWQWQRRDGFTCQREASQDVILTENRILGTLELNLRARVLAEEDLIAQLDADRDDGTTIEKPARADTEHSAALRFLLRGVRQDNAPLSSP